MKLDGSTVQYFLAREFREVTSKNIARGELFDYPMLYDVSVDMGGHVVIVPEHERPSVGPYTASTLFVCVAEESALASIETGAPTIWIHDDVVFQQLYNLMLGTYVKNERLDAQLNAYVDTYAGFQPLLTACAKTLGCSCALVDEEYRIIGQADGRAGGNTPEAPLLEVETIDLFMASREYQHMRSSRNVFAVPGTSDLFMKNVFSDDRMVGTLIVRHAGEVLSARYARFLLGYLTPFVEAMYANIGFFDLPTLGSERVRASLLSTLKGNVAAPASLAAALADDGHEETTNYVVLRIERSFTHETEAELGYLARRFEFAFPRTYSFIADGNLFMLADVGAADTDQRRAFRRNLPVAARDNLAKVGVSRPFSDMGQLVAAREQASIALAQGSQTDPTFWFYRFSDYALSWVLARVTAGMPAEYVRHPAVATLEAYDRSHGTELTRTLTTFMHSRYNATAAAQELYVARSTLLNRLDRIIELTQIDLDNPRDRLYLALSLELKG